jgi:hypothetical protein
MWNFVSADKADTGETKFYIQKYDGLENIEIRSPPLEVPPLEVPPLVTLGSSTDTNLGHNHIKI